METLTIAWEYLTGYAVATDPTSRDRAEWPPHPARIFMALAAAWFETEPPEAEGGDRDDWIAEGAALRWVESLGDPELCLPNVDGSAARSIVTVYVPVNDRAGPSAATLQSCPAMARSKQPRSFPKIWVGGESCILFWPNAEGVAGHRDALSRLCRKVTRIGHSSSLVSMRVADDIDLKSEGTGHFVVDELQATRQLRSLSRGTLDMLRDRFGDESRRRHEALSREIEELKSRKSKGKEGKELKAKLQELEAQRAEIVPRLPVRPTTGLSTGYRDANATPMLSGAKHTLFDHDILILSQVQVEEQDRSVKGPVLPVVSTFAVTKALRDTILSKGPQPPPGWVSGHLPDGQPLRDGNGHLALIPLPFVGHEHADGHLLGVALAFPRSVAPKERGRVLGKLLVNEKGESKPVELKLGRLGVWKVQKRDWQETRTALQPETWTAFPNGEKIWASVTPVVLDRFPKADRLVPSQREAWEAEVEQIIRAACARIGLPEPELVDFGTTGWQMGSPRAVCKRRPLRPSSAGADAALGDGFPAFPPKGTNAPRPQVHVWLRFAEPVIGPVILGAGRYLGYGFCKPLRGSQP